MAEGGGEGQTLLARKLANQADYFGKDAKTMYAAARDAAQRAIDLDPRAVDGYLSMFYVNQDYDWDWTSARRVAAHAQQLQPDNSSALGELASSAYAQGLWDTAISFSRQAVARDPLSLNVHILLRYDLSRDGSPNRSRRHPYRIQQFPTGYEDRIGWIYATWGDLDNAFTWFDRAYERRDAWLIWIKCMPEAPKLASDPRYKALLRKMNLPE